LFAAETRGDMHIDELFDALKANTKTVLSTMPRESDGSIAIKPVDLGLTLLACAWGFALHLGATVEQLQRVVTRCAEELEHAQSAPKIVS
jgi:hypothetical protein